MSDIVWQDPPPPPDTKSGLLRAFVEALKMRPGEWALYPKPHRTTAGAYNNPKDYPGTEWTARKRDDGRGWDLYGRWVGE